MVNVLHGLNDAQKKAVTHGRGPLLVLAGPGSGKTRVLTHRVAWLVASGLAAPERVLAVTFTRKAAEEIKERLAGLLGPEAAGRVWAGTFHSACLRVLREDGWRVGLRNFSVVDEEDREVLLKRVAERLDLSSGEAESAGKAVSFAKNCLVGPAEFPAWARDFSGSDLLSYRKEDVLSCGTRLAHRMYLAYQELLREANGLDFDDLLFEAVRLFRERPEVLEKWRRRWKWVLVDEYQDTNRAQYEWLKMLVEQHRNVTAVGDPDQSIYGWRAADVENILRFREDFPEAEVVALELNYRSVPAVVSAALDLIRHNSRREEKNLRAARGGGEGDGVRCFAFPDGAAEAEFVADEILSLRERLGLPWGSFAVLYRRNAMSGEFERALARRGVPYEVVGSVSFWKRKEVKDALAFLRVAVNPRDAVSLERVCRLLPGVGEGRAKEAAGFCFGGLPAWDALREVAGKKGVRKKAREALLGLAGLLLALEAGVRAGENAGELLRKALEGSGYLAALERDATEEGRERLENVAVLVSAATEVGSVDELLSRAALESGDGEEGGSRRDAVRLMTLHRAKGLEFPVVFLVGAEEGGLPDYRNAGGPPLEEERRLFFVGMTRAMDFLYVTRAECRGLWGRGQRRPPSRFIAEAGLEEVRALPGRTAPGRADCHGRLERPDPKRLAAFRAV